MASNHSYTSFLKSINVKMITPYLGANVIHSFKCGSKGHTFATSPCYLKKRGDCLECLKLSRNKQHTPLYINDTVMKNIEILGFTLVGQYSNHRRMNFICSKGHKFMRVAMSIKKLSPCPVCLFNKIHGHDQFNELLASINYKALTPYTTNKKNRMNISCDKGHVFPTTRHKITLGERCPECK